MSTAAVLAGGLAAGVAGAASGGSDSTATQNDERSDSTHVPLDPTPVTPTPVVSTPLYDPVRFGYTRSWTNRNVDLNIEPTLLKTYQLGIGSQVQESPTVDRVTARPAEPGVSDDPTYPTYTEGAEDSVEIEGRLDFSTLEIEFRYLDGRLLSAGTITCGIPPTTDSPFCGDATMKLGPEVFWHN